MTRKRVVCAVVLKGDRVLMARRAPHQKHAGNWEFPGGKVESGESDQAALEREIYEEFGVSGKTLSHVCDSLCAYPKLDLEILLCAYIFMPERFEFDLRVHDAVQFFTASELDALDLTLADRPIAEAVGRTLLSSEKKVTKKQPCL